MNIISSTIFKNPKLRIFDHESVFALLRTHCAPPAGVCFGVVTSTTASI